MEREREKEKENEQCRVVYEDQIPRGGRSSLWGRRYDEMDLIYPRYLITV